MKEGAPKSNVLFFFSVSESCKELIDADLLSVSNGNDSEGDDVSVTI